MFPGCEIHLLLAELLKDLTVVQKLVLGNFSTVSENFLHVAETPLAAFENFAPVLEPLLVAAANFVHAAATPSAAFESFVPVPEAL